MKTRHQKLTRASALVLTLIMVVAVCVILVGFTTTARLEQTTAGAYSNAEAAAAYRDMGVDTAVARLITSTEGNRFWASAPGRIFTMPRETSGWGDPQVIDLSSGESPDASHSADLNPSSLLHAGGVLQESTTIPLRLRWIYVRQDGSLEAGDDIPNFNSQNPLVGRYAFWVDDLSARINLNTAATRSGSGDAINHPARVDLTSLDEITTVEVDKLKALRQTRMLNSSGEAGRVDKALADWIMREALSFTPYNHSNDANVFNEPKLLLTTKASIANGRPFFDITTAADADPGLFDNLNDTKVAALFQRIYTILNRTDRPLFKDKSYVQKYGDRQAAQMVIDLIDYVRAAESPMVAIEPIRGTFSAATRSFVLNSGAIDFMANGRKPYITQIAVAVSTLPAGGWRLEYAIEVTMPEWEGGGTVDLSTMRLYIGLWGGGTQQVDISESMVVGGSKLLGSGEHKTIQYSHTVFGSTPPPNPLPVHFALYSKATTRRFDIAALGTSRIMYQYEEPAPGSVYTTPSVSVNDPFINKRPENWVVGPSDFNRAAGARPRASTLGSPAATSQDSDASGNVTSVGVRVPAPGAGVRSVGEIGHIHTGSKGVPETPWRTVRLRPSSSDLPDWLLLDEFAAPVVVGGIPQEQAALKPTDGATGGLQNLNTFLFPFALKQSGAERQIPLRALLHEVEEAGGVIGAVRRNTLASSILNQTPAVGTPAGNFHLPSVDGIEKFYLFPGQVAEVNEVALHGEESEELVRQIAPLLTTRGNVFSIYSIGQSIRQPANGTIHVQGEQYSATIVERKDRFRVVFQKEIEP